MNTALSTAIALLVLLARPAVAGPSAMKLGTKAPLFSCPMLADGGKEGVASLKEMLAKDQVVVMSFFHTTCKPCMSEIPRLTKILAGKDASKVTGLLVFIGTEDDGTVKAFLKEKGFTLPVVMDRYGMRVGEKYKVVTDEVAHVPQIMVISKNGILRSASAGFPPEAEATLSGLIDTLVAEAKEAPVAQDQVAILFTNNDNGMTGPSPMIDVGGLAKRATILKRERAAAAAVVVDAGDSFPTSPDEVRTKQVVAAYKLMKYDALTIGEAEFVNGTKFLRGLIDRKELPYVSANVLLCDKDVCVNLTKAQAVVTAGKRKVAVLGYLHPDALGFTPEERMTDGKYKVQIKDPAPFIKGFIARFRKEADVLVVLSHAGVEEDRKLAQDNPELDVIIGAHSQTMLVDPVREGNTIIGQAASDGQYVGKLVLKFNEEGKPGLESYELIPLTKNIADDAEVKAVIGIKTAAAQ